MGRVQDALPSNWHTHPPTKRLCGVKRARVAVREARQLDGVRCLARLRFGGRMPSMAAVARSLQEVFDDVEIVHLLTDAKAERTVVMTWRDTWRNESYELG